MHGGNDTLDLERGIEIACGPGRPDAAGSLIDALGLGGLVRAKAQGLAMLARPTTRRTREILLTLDAIDEALGRLAAGTDRPA